MRAALRLGAVALLWASIVAAQREHKVHNIVLYPHKHSWCKTTAIKQVVAHPGCDAIEVENNVCVGGCFSYSIPRTIPAAPGEVAPYCDSCQPSTHSWKQVALNCSSGDYEGEGLTKMVQIIENCTCAKCRDQSQPSLLEGEGEVPEVEPVEKPQLMDIVDTAHRYGNYTIVGNNGTQANANSTVINQRTMVLLGELSGREGEGEAEALGGDQLAAVQETLHLVEGDDHKIDGLVLKDFVRRVEEEGHVNINLERLQQVLEKVEQSEHKARNAHRHQHMMTGPHHSLVLPRDSVQTPEMFLKPTLDVPSHLMRPAHEGSELSYHNNLLPADRPDDLDDDDQ